jgi:hypothetical protein
MSGTNALVRFVNAGTGVFIGGVNESSTGPGGPADLFMGPGARMLSPVTVWPLGTVECAGLISNNVRNTGTVSPGWPVGTMTVTNGTFYNTYNTSNGTLRIDLGGALAGEYDRLVVYGNMVLGGTLAVSFTNGFFPSSGQTFDVLDWTGTASGQFDTVTLPQLPPTRTWNTNLLYAQGELRVDALVRGTVVQVR